MHAIYAKVLEVLVPQDYHLKKNSILNVTMQLPSEGTKQSIPLLGNRVYHTKAFFAMSTSYTRFGTMTFKIRETKHVITKVIASLQLELKWLPKDSVVTSWFSMETDHSLSSILIQLKVHISSTIQGRPFNAPASNSLIQFENWEAPFLSLQPHTAPNFLNTDETIQGQNALFPAHNDMHRQPSNERINLQDIPSLYVTSKPLVSYNTDSTDHMQFD